MNKIVNSWRGGKENKGIVVCIFSLLYFFKRGRKFVTAGGTPVREGNDHPHHHLKPAETDDHKLTNFLKFHRAYSKNVVQAIPLAIA
ncbi:hypothetical protein CHS0354_019672 [Potamilus streckersoni]|uniref:Uncharacterized protein n=1 Tax=Potamilus streckersoni TaxID=2493646 RepID=A0AAE0T920_9BIVA|nr:hypothetical protein CHS0354_019672 [Potamilus streckersoni]